MTTSEQIKVRQTQVICTAHPEWGTSGVMEDRGTYFEIYNSSGWRVLSKTEADTFWTVARPAMAKEPRKRGLSHVYIIAETADTYTLIAQGGDTVFTRKKHEVNIDV